MEMVSYCLAEIIGHIQQLHFTASSPLDTILELRSNGQGWASSWTTLTTKLKHPREYHVVIPVVMDIDACELTKENKREP